MFQVNPNTGAITMHRGDTGSVLYSAERESGEPFGEDDVALYTITDSQKNTIRQDLYHLDDATLGNGNVLVQFHNSDTDQLPLGTYSTEIRYIINPRFEETVINGVTIRKVVDGDIVRTPEPLGQSTLTIKDVYGEV